MLEAWHLTGSQLGLLERPLGSCSAPFNWKCRPVVERSQRRIRVGVISLSRQHSVQNVQEIPACFMARQRSGSPEGFFQVNHAESENG